MPLRIKRSLFLTMVTSLFVTIGMLAYSSENDPQRKTQEISDPFIWSLRQLDDNKNQNYSKAVNSSSRPVSREKPKNVSRPENTSAVPFKTNTKGEITVYNNGSLSLGLKNSGRVDVSHALMEERRNRVKSVCTETNQNTKTPSIRDVLYSSKHKFYYCPVEKVASTFWRRFIYQLQYTNPVRSPFDVPIMKALRGMRDLHLPPRLKTDKELEQVLQESTKLLFVRDPHSRIFSAYVDKLLAPNPYYWKVWALPAIMRYRENHHKVHTHAHCGHDVTFEEFVKYVINIASNNDGHVMPINRMCTPCAVPYTIIGKMESFGDDIKMLFDFLHLNTTPLRLDNMKQETTMDALADSATDALSGSWLVSSLKCITKEAVLQRIWRKNQIRGFISWRHNIKLTATEIQYMNSNNFIKLLKDASKLSTNKEELKLQKRQAMKEAFATIDNGLLKSIVEKYGDDLKLFEYDKYPLWLNDLQSSDFVNTKAFDYSKEWDLSKLVNKT